MKQFLYEEFEGWLWLAVSTWILCKIPGFGCVVVWVIVSAIWFLVRMGDLANDK